jgi:hypothetical protein
LPKVSLAEPGGATESRDAGIGVVGKPHLQRLGNQTAVASSIKAKPAYVSTESLVKNNHIRRAISQIRRSELQEL